MDRTPVSQLMGRTSQCCPYCVHSLYKMAEYDSKTSFSVQCLWITFTILSLKYYVTVTVLRTNVGWYQRFCHSTYIEKYCGTTQQQRERVTATQYFQ